MSAATTDRLTLAAALIFPALCVIGSQFVGVGASSANADERVEFELPSPTPGFTLSTGDPELITGIAIESPFYFESIEPEQHPLDLVDNSTPEPRPSVPQALPAVTVTSILPHPRNPLAIIDGKPRRVGDTLESGWTVLSISGSDFTVTLRHSSGREIRERMKKN
jgi:hypothetical protein